MKSSKVKKKKKKNHSLPKHASSQMGGWGGRWGLFWFFFPPNLKISFKNVAIENKLEEKKGG